MRGGLYLFFGGIVGAFSAVCVISLGVSRLDFLLFSLFFVAISSLVLLVIEDQMHRHANIGMRTNTRVALRLLHLQSTGRICFGASLASSLICALTQTSVKISLVFSTDMITAGLISTLCFVGYVGALLLLLSFGQRQHKTTS